MGEALDEPAHGVHTGELILEPAYRQYQMLPRELLACYLGIEHVIWERPHWLDQPRPPLAHQEAYVRSTGPADQGSCFRSIYQRRYLGAEADPARLGQQRRLPAAVRPLTQVSGQPIAVIE